MFVRLYPGDDGQSHFEELDNPFGPSERALVKEIRLRTSKPGNVYRGNALFRHYDITLSGGMEIEIGDGSIRRFGPGDVLFAEDLTGQGHVGQIDEDTPRVYLLAALEDQPDDASQAYQDFVSGS
jgi:hypothetical protein